MDYSIRIGGEAGQGVQTIGGMMGKILSRRGYHVFTHQDYMSRVRGGHNYYQIRFADKPVTASRDKVDIIVALDLNTVEIHRRDLSADGVILYDSQTVKKGFDGEEFLDVPFEPITLTAGGEKIMANTVATGAILGVLNLGLESLNEIIRLTLKKTGDEGIDRNIAVGKAGFEYVRDHCKGCDAFQLAPAGPQGLLLIDGISAVGLGALVAGCTFYSAYPMTPSTGILNYLAGKAEKYGLVVEQAEDEIAAINMALGASFAGVRAMTGTSGGGFALMQEGVSLAGITETPIVIAEMQRPGPATGLPTRTEQADLLFVVHAGHGEFPRVILTPGTPAQAYHLTKKAFDLADKYQIPVFIQGDQYLNDSEWTFADLDQETFPYHDYRLRGEQLKELSSYKRYAYTDTGISPLAVPGQSNHLVVVDSDEHDEEGHIIEEADIRSRMVQKRLFLKLPLIRREMAPPTLYGDESPEMVLAGYGSTYGVIREIVDLLSGEKKIAMLHFSEVYPLPLTEPFDYLALLGAAAITVCIENNATSQFARLLRAETGYQFSGHIIKYDGRPFTVETLLGEVHGYLR